MNRRILQLFCSICLLILSLAGPVMAAETSNMRLILPSSVRGESDSLQSVSNILDGDVETQPSWQNGNLSYLYFQFAEGVNPRVVKFYVPGDTANIYALEYLTAYGTWASVPGLGYMSGDQMKKGWNRLPLNLNTPATQFRLKVEKKVATVGVGIGEVQFWAEVNEAALGGEKRYPAAENMVLEFANGVLVSGSAEGYHIKLDVPAYLVQKAELVYDVYNLKSYTEGFWTLNGSSAHSLSPKGKKDTWVSEVEEFDPGVLHQGDNAILFKINPGKQDSLKIKNVGLKLYFATGEAKIISIDGTDYNAAMLPNLFDGDPRTYWETDWQIHDQVALVVHLAEVTDVEYLSWLQDRFFVDAVRVEYLTSDGWQLLNHELNRQDLTDGWNRLQAEHPVTTDTLRLTFLNPLGKHLIGPLCELKVWGSSVSSRQNKPEIAITYPRDGELVQQEFPLKGFIKGAYDRVTGNGESITVQDNYFEQPRKLEPAMIAKSQSTQSTTGGSTETLTVNAYQGSEIVGTESVVVPINPGPALTIQSPADGYLTTDTQVDVCVTTDSIYNNVYINGAFAGSNDTEYHLMVPLAEGTNQITAMARDMNAGVTQKSIYVRRDSQGPVIHFTNDYSHVVLPESQTTFELKGYVEDYSASCTLYINGTEVSLQNGAFDVIKPVVKGLNTFRFMATDMLSNQTVMTVNVYVDNTPPDAFTPTVQPAGWSTISRPVVSFSTVDRPSGISYYELKIDNGTYQRVTSPYTLPALADGQHTVNVKAVDQAGLYREVPVQVNIDTLPPAQFTPVVDPAGWTRQNQPVLTFNTTDAASGVDHYEVQVDDGAFTRVESPYQLPVLADGTHQITVRAVDKAGLTTTGTTQVNIDTVAPITPALFEVVPGNGEMALNWSKSSADVMRYGIYRNPAWGNANLRYVDSATAVQYIDKEVINGTTYAYYIFAVDRANNTSEPTQKLSGEAGISQVTIQPSAGGVAKYSDKVTIVIPENAIQSVTDASIDISTVDTLDVRQTTNPLVSDTYRFGVVDQTTGVVQDATFNQNLTVKMSYDPNRIPDGYAPHDLDVYYYNDADGIWVRMPKSGYDLENGQIIFQTNHFSMYNVEVTQNYSPTAADYQDLGIAPYNNYFQNNEEFVSPSSGNLTLKATDVNLPGRNGLNLKIGRVYSSSQAAWDHFSEITPFYGYLGAGWRLSIPHIEDTAEGQFIYLEDGSGIKCKWERGTGSDTRNNTFSYHEGTHFTAIKIQHAFYDFWSNEGYEIYFKDGTKYEFDRKGKLTRMVDRTGQNEIVFAYGSDSHISSITDTLKRNITFAYDHDKITNILVDGESFVTYGYDVTNQLNSVKDRMNRETRYYSTLYPFTTGYFANYTTTLDYGDGPNPGSQKSENRRKYWQIPLISKIAYPMGSVSKYVYTVSGLRLEDIDDTGSGSNDCGEPYTSHTTGMITYYDNKSRVKNHGQYLSAQATEELNPVSYDYVTRRTGTDHREWVSQATLTQAYQKTVMDFNEDGLNTTRQIFDITVTPAQLYQKEVSEYNGNKDMTKKTVYYGNNPAIAYTETYRYDNWGNVVESYNSTSNLRHYYYYLNTGSDLTDLTKQPQFVLYDTTKDTTNYGNLHNLLSDEFVLNQNGTTSIPEETHYQYNSLGNLMMKARLHKNKWVKTNYDYDNYGNLKMVTDAANNITQLLYDSTNTFLVKIIKDAVKDANGVVQQRIVTQSGYDPTTGSKTWDIDPLGALTEYKYDKVGRLLWTKLPDETDTFTGTIGNLNPSMYSNRADNPVKLQIFDDTTNIATVANVVLGSKTYVEAVTFLNSLTTGIADNGDMKVYGMARHVYDSMNRRAELRQYLRDTELQTIDNLKQVSPFVTKFAYDKVGNRIKETDANGYVTFKVYDGLNRLTDIYYPDAEKNKVSWSGSNYHLQIKYDPNQNMRTVYDAEGNKTEELKDWNVNVTQVTRYDKTISETTSYSTQAFYDSIGNAYKAVDGKGQEFISVYDDWNQLTENQLPATDVIVPGTNALSKINPTTKYEYNDLGQKTAETAPNVTATETVGDYRVEYAYDAAGRQIQMTVKRSEKDLITVNTYDLAGRLLKVVDPEQQILQKEYNPEGLVVAETDQMGGIMYHQYNPFGKEIATTDPRGVVTQGQSGWKAVKVAGKQYYLNPAYTVTMNYDSLGRLVKTTDVKGTTTEIKYDEVGAKREELITAGLAYPEGGTRLTKYVYTPQYWLKSVTRGDSNLSYKVEYDYDKAGKKIKDIYPDAQGMAPGSNVYIYEYDGLGRLHKVTKPDGTVESYGYDPTGNQTSVTNGRNYTTAYDYNGLNKLSLVTEPTSKKTQYVYDPNGNLVRKDLPDGLSSSYIYNDLNLLAEEIKTRAGDLMDYKYAYDRNGKVKAKSDPRGVVTAFSYYANGQVKEEQTFVPETPGMSLDLNQVQVGIVPTGFTGDEHLYYVYDQVGNLTRITDGPGYESMVYDELNRVTSQTRQIDDKTYVTNYGYDFVGNLTKIQYPGSSTWVTYDYNMLNRLTAIGGFADDAKTDPVNKPANFVYDAAGNLVQLRYNNGVVTATTLDQRSRPDTITVQIPDGPGMKTALFLDYAYDSNGNVTQRNNNSYAYDELDRLTTAQIEGSFLFNTAVTPGYVQNDYLANAPMEYPLDDKQIALDYAAGTLGMKFDSPKQVGRIELSTNKLANHRIIGDHLRIFAKSDAAGTFTEIPVSNWTFAKDAGTGKISITFANTVTATELKIHANYDERDITTGLAKDESQFANNLRDIVKVFGRYNRTNISYQYDSMGNRTFETVTDVNSNYTVTYAYNYYAGSDRLKTRTSQMVNGVKANGSYTDGIITYSPSDEKAYQYDIAGNMIAKGNSYSFNGNSVSFVTSGSGVEYWRYKYDAAGQLSTVWKNGTDDAHIISRYGYDYGGKRLKVVENNKVTHTVYDYSGHVVFEAEYHVDSGDPYLAKGDALKTDKTTSYIYGPGGQIAKVEGNVTTGAKFYYHHDNLGSVMMMTKELDAAKVGGDSMVVFKQDYTPFGQNLYAPGATTAPKQQTEPNFKFTGQQDDASTGLYYYMARYYDPEIGRFISEDSFEGDLLNPQTLNQYNYTLANPLKYIDPTGHFGERPDMMEDTDVMDIADAQMILSQLGYDLEVDGFNGPETQAAVRDYQEKHGLKVDGIIGPKTTASLEKAGADLVKSVVKSIVKNSNVEKKQDTQGELPIGSKVDSIRFDTKLSTLDLLARTLYGECINDDTAMYAVATVILNRQALETAGKKDYSYDAKINWNDGTYIKGTRVDKENTLRNIVLAPLQFTGLTGEKEYRGNGNLKVLAPKTDSALWKTAVRIAQQMTENPKSLPKLKGLDGVTSFLGSSLFKSYDDITYTAVLKSGTVKHNAYNYGDNIFFK